MAGPVELVLTAVATLQSATADVAARREASLLLEQARKGDAHVLLGVGGALLAPAHAMEARIMGYTFLTDLVRHKWRDLSDAEKSQVSQLAYQQATTVYQEGRVSRPLMAKAAVLLSAAVRQQGGDAYGQVVPRLIQAATEGPQQAELACTVLHYISEDTTFEDSSGGESKRAFLAALTTSVPAVFPYLCETLQQQFMQAVKAQQDGAADTFAAHSAVIHAAMAALATWVEWTPMARVAGSNVLDACAFFLTAPDFRLAALDVLKQIAMRRRATEAWAEYAGLMDRVAGTLLKHAADVGLLVAPGQLSPALSQELDWGGAQEEVGRRLLGLVIALAESHMRALASEERRLQLLQLLLVFTMHPFLQLPAAALPVWAQLLREALPGSSANTGNNASLHALPAAALAEVVGATVKGAAPPIPIPLEACMALLRALFDILCKAVTLGDAAAAAVAADTGTSSGGGAAVSDPSGSQLMANMPQYFDSVQDLKEACIALKGHSKTAIRLITNLYPEQCVALAGSVLQQAMGAASAASAANAGGAAGAAAGLHAAALQLECANHFAEAVLPQAIEQCGAQPALLEPVVGLLQGVQSVRFSIPRLVTLHARCLDMFGKVLVPRPDLAALLVRTALEAMGSIPLSAPGPEPPPPRITREWKQGMEARISMASLVANYAKAAPAALAQHLRPLADQVGVMYEGGQLTEGERVLLWEALMAAAGGVSAALATQLVGWLLGPLAATWTSPEWQARHTSPQAFIQVYAPVEPATHPDAPPTIGGRRERWALYHQMTLLERAMRRTAPAAGSSGGGAGPGPVLTPDGRPGSPGAADPGAAYPMNGHLYWVIPGAMAILRCIHALGAADAAGLLGRLTGIMAMDEVEKAMRVVGDDVTSVRDAREPRCVAGSSLVDVRYLLRGVREACWVIVSLATQHASQQAFWARPDLAAAVNGAATSNLQALDHAHVRLLLRHIAAPLVLRCPPLYARTWVLPALAAFLPHLAVRLRDAWAVAQAGGSTAVLPSRSSSGAGAETAGREGRRRQDVDEVAGDVMLRELTREAMALLVCLTLSPGERPGDRPASSSDKASKRPAGSTSPGRGDGGRVGEPAVAAAAHKAARRGAQSASASAADGGSLVDARQHVAADGAAASDAPFALVAQQQPDVMMAVASLAVSGLCWPDGDAAGKAVSVCKFLVAWGQREHGPLEDVAVGPMLQAAVTSLTQIHTADVQGEVLALVRAIVVGALAWPPAATRVRSELQSLLRVPAQALADFEAQLTAKNGEKEQRLVIRQLLAWAGGEEVQKILTTSVAKPPSALVAVKEPVPSRQRDPVQADADARLQGAIFGAIFPD